MPDAKRFRLFGVNRFFRFRAVNAAIVGRARAFRENCVSAAQPETVRDTPRPPRYSPDA